jgi:hypothetical protein
MNVQQIAKAFEQAGFVVKLHTSDHEDIEDHSVEIVDTNFHITVHPDGLYFTAVEEEDGEFTFHDDLLTIEEIISTVRASQ